MTDQVFWALIGTLFGGGGLAVITKVLNRGKDKFDLAAAIREELREDIKRYQVEVEGYKKETAALRKEVDDWRSKYFEMDRKHNETIDSLEDAIEKMKRILHENGINYSDVK